MIVPLLVKMTQVVSSITGFLFAYDMFDRYLPHQLRGPITRCYEKIFSFLSPFIHITFHEYDGDGFERNTAYEAISRYLNATSAQQAKGLVANVARGSEAIVLSMSQYGEVADEYQGIKLWWASRQTTPNRQTITFYPRQDEKRFFKLRFHRKHRDLVTGKYLKHVLGEGKAIAVKERNMKLYTNNKSACDFVSDFQSSMWSHVVFEHPATFETLAMDPEKKLEIMDDLLNFAESKDYYAKIGKAWKRGYLLYGPPGTGKSTMIAAMANLLKYDVYGLELTAVKDNTELRKLLIDTSSKSLIVIEDIDCSLELTGQRKKKDEDDGEEEKIKGDPVMEELIKMDDQKKKSQVTLSGLLNFIDGLWSACRGERIIVFTTNYVEKLDSALIRRGRMDKHIELSYCGFEVFKVLANNYLGIDSHDSFATIRRLLEETNMTPADVAESLMPKSRGEDEESCLQRLIKALEEAKEEARRKAKDQEEQDEEKEIKVNNSENENGVATK